MCAPISVFWHSFLIYSTAESVKKDRPEAKKQATRDAAPSAPISALRVSSAPEQPTAYEESVSSLYALIYSQ